MLLVDDLAAGGTKNLRHTPRGLVTLMWPELMCAVSLILKRIMLSLPLASADIISRRFVN